MWSYLCYHLEAVITVGIIIELSFPPSFTYTSISTVPLHLPLYPPLPLTLHISFIIYLTIVIDVNTWVLLIDSIFVFSGSNDVVVSVFKSSKVKSVSTTDDRSTSSAFLVFIEVITLIADDAIVIVVCIGVVAMGIVVYVDLDVEVMGIVIVVGRVLIVVDIVEVGGIVVIVVGIFVVGRVLIVVDIVEVGGIVVIVVGIFVVVVVIVVVEIVVVVVVVVGIVTLCLFLVLVDVVGIIVDVFLSLGGMLVIVAGIFLV